MGVEKMKSQNRLDKFEEEFTEEDIQEKLEHEGIDSVEAGFMIGYYS